MRPSPWLAIDASTRPAERARELRRAWEQYIGGDPPTVDLREPIVRSWRRSLDAGVPPAGRVLLPITDVGDRWLEHPLHRALPLMRDVLDGVAAEGRQLIVITDEHGYVLWLEGDRRVRTRAEEMGAVEGTRWDERSVGTNAVGAALELEHAIQVFAGEHFNEAVHGWTCAAAPIRDPAGCVLGVINLTGRLESVHPYDLALAVATARAAEAHLRMEQHERDARLRERHLDRFVRLPARQRALVGPDGHVLLAEPEGWISASVAIPAGGGPLALPSGARAVAEPVGADGAYLLRAERAPDRRAPTLTLTALGRDRALASLAGGDVELSQRRSELLVLLAGRPEGMAAEELALAVYGDSGKPATVRSEMFRLRRLLGRWLRAEPYRLAMHVDADFLAVRELLRAGRVLEAAQHYPAPLLVRSQAPGVVWARRELDEWLRRAVLSAGDRETLWAWLQTGSGRDDLLGWKRFLAGLDYGDARRPEAAARLAQLRDSLEPAG